MSPGTERAVTELAQSSLVAKARARPDLVRQVVEKARRDGFLTTARSVRARLDDDIPLGYSAAGIAIEVGEAVAGIHPGQLVATGGAGKANHAELQAVPGLLCAAVPEGVPATDAAFTTVASIALHGLRLADVGPGSKVAIVGLGLMGHLALRLARAAGCDVAGIDVSEAAVERARAAGAFALIESGADTTKAVQEWSRGRGVDAVLLTAATPSSAPMGRSPEICRDGANVVIIGDVGLDLDRRPFYERELSVRFARSYGPGRYERSYEEWGVDLPVGLVRWSEGRNFEAVLDLLAAGSLQVADLVTHRFTIADAAAAYELVRKGDEPYVGIAFEYPDTGADDRPIVLHHASKASHAGAGGVGMIGAGAFASTVLVPALRAAGFDRLVAVASASGLSARHLADRSGFEKAVSGADAVLADPDVDVVVIATPHDMHSRLTAVALRAGKHVFCEKPLALTMGELDDVESALRESAGVLFVGFNRRSSDAVRTVADHFAEGTGPLVVTYRVSAGILPAKHWYNDRRQGGRLLGEVCHFVDTCSAIVGSDAIDVQAMSSGRGEMLLGQDLVLVLRYPAGDLATISYATGGHSSTEKERIDVLGRGRSAAIVDFRQVLLDGRQVMSAGQDKGHNALMRAFREAVRSGSNGVVHGLASTRTTLAAAASLIRES
jgi:predicted dehydrogenase